MYLDRVAQNINIGGAVRETLVDELLKIAFDTRSRYR